MKKNILFSHLRLIKNRGDIFYIKNTLHIHDTQRLIEYDRWKKCLIKIIMMSIINNKPSKILTIDCKYSQKITDSIIFCLDYLNQYHTASFIKESIRNLPMTIDLNNEFSILTQALQITIAKNEVTIIDISFDTEIDMESIINNLKSNIILLSWSIAYGKNNIINTCHQHKKITAVIINFWKRKIIKFTIEKELLDIAYNKITYALNTMHANHSNSNIAQRTTDIFSYFNKILK